MLFLLISCQKEELVGTYDITLTGIIEQAGYTTYMYGTHRIYDNILYALKSDSIDLDQYVGEEVILGGELLPQHLNQDDPPYVNVLEIIKK